MWIIYYDDDTTFDSSMGEPEEAPTTGIIVIAQPDPDVGRHLIQRFDWYWWLEEWYGGDWFGMVDAFMHRRGRALKAGRTISNPRFQTIMKRAAEDSRLPVKSAWREDEARWVT